MAREPWIRASEIGEYLYCRRSWWLGRVLELEPTGHKRREHGVTQHRRHGQQVWVSHLLVVLGVALLLVGLVLTLS